MKSDIDIKELWRKQAVPFADCSGLFKEVNHFKRKKVLELIVLNAVLWMTICFVAFVWIYFKAAIVGYEDRDSFDNRGYGHCCCVHS